LICCIDPDGIGEVIEAANTFQMQFQSKYSRCRSHIRFTLLLQRILACRLESLLDVYRFFRGGLEAGPSISTVINCIYIEVHILRDISLLLAPGHSPLLRDHSTTLLHINLVSDNDEWEVLRVSRRCLNEEFISPRVERLK